MACFHGLPLRKQFGSSNNMDPALRFRAAPLSRGGRLLPIKSRLVGTVSRLPARGEACRRFGHSARQEAPSCDTKRKVLLRFKRFSTAGQIRCKSRSTKTSGCLQEAGRTAKRGVVAREFSHNDAARPQSRGHHKSEPRPASQRASRPNHSETARRLRPGGFTHDARCAGPRLAFPIRPAVSCGAIMIGCSYLFIRRGGGPVAPHVTACSARPRGDRAGFSISHPVPRDRPSYPASGPTRGALCLHERSAIRREVLKRHFASTGRVFL
jgi:hypothetical protein